MFDKNCLIHVILLFAFQKHRNIWMSIYLGSQFSKFKIMERSIINVVYSLLKKIYRFSENRSDSQTQILEFFDPLDDYTHNFEFMIRFFTQLSQIMGFIHCLLRKHGPTIERTIIGSYGMITVHSNLIQTGLVFWMSYT